MPPFPPDASVEFKSLRDDTLLLSLAHGGASGYLAILYDDAAAAKGGLERVFAADERLSDVLAAVAPGAMLEIDLPAGDVRRAKADGRWSRPCAVTVSGPRDALPSPTAALAALRDILDAHAPAPGSVADAALAEWTDPDGRAAAMRLSGPDGRRVEISRGAEAVASFDLAEVPHLLRGLAKASPDAPVPDAPGEPAFRAFAAGRPPIRRAARVVLARLYAAFPEGLSLAELEGQATAAGLDRGMAEAALAELDREGRTTLRDGVHVIRSDGDPG